MTPPRAADMPQPQTLFDALSATARRFGDDHGMRFYDTPESSDYRGYAELDARARTIAAALRARGGRARQSVVIALPARAAWADAVYGMLYAGARLRPHRPAAGPVAPRGPSQLATRVGSPSGADRGVGRTNSSANRSDELGVPCSRVEDLLDRRRSRPVGLRPTWTATRLRRCSSRPVRRVTRRASWHSPRSAGDRGGRRRAAAGGQRLDPGRLAAAAPRDGSHHAGDRARHQRRTVGADHDRAVPAASDVLAAADQRPPRHASASRATSRSRCARSSRPTSRSPNSTSRA